MLGCNEWTNDSPDEINSQFELTEYKKVQSTITGKSLDESTKVQYFLNNKYGSKMIQIDSNQFKTTFNHSFPMIVNLSFGFNVNYPVFISPGDSIHLEYYEIDLLNNFKRISFSGNHSKENDLLIELKEILKYDNTNYNNFFNCSEETFLQKIDSIQEIANGILQNYKKEKLTPFKDFELLTQSYIDYKIANYVEEYPYKMKNAYIQGTIELSDKYINKRKSFLTRNSNHLNNISFSNYAVRVASRNALKIFSKANYDKKGRGITDLKCYFSSIDSIFKNKEIIDHLKYLALIQEINLTRKKPELFYELYKESNPNSNYLLSLNEVIKKTTIITRDYVFKDSKGNNRYLSEFKNKIIYIDIWATWCGPCLQERKHFEELINKFGSRNENIVFVGISIDTDIMKWKNMLNLKNMKGIQLISPQGFKSDICKDFGIGGIPRFMIVNRDGIVIESNALRPSREGIYTYLKKMIG